MLPTSQCGMVANLMANVMVNVIVKNAYWFHVAVTLVIPVTLASWLMSWLRSGLTLVIPGGLVIAGSPGPKRFHQRLTLGD